MNIIDDFSGYVWSIPLRSKSHACPALQTWHKAVTVQSGESLRIITTDNGELVSKSMQNWCQTLGINHQLTAPYTSAQNGTTPQNNQREGTNHVPCMQCPRILLG